MSKSQINFLLFLTSLFLLGFFFYTYLIDLSWELDNFSNHLFSAQFLSSFYEAQKEKIILIFAGDIMLDRGVEQMIEIYGNGDYGFPFLRIKDYFQKANILFANLEGPISNQGQKVGSIYSFRSDPKAIEGLNFAGFNILSIANNHAFDYGRVALEDTMLRLKSAQIDYVGAGFNEKEAYSPAIKEVKGTRFAFLAYTNLGSELWKAQEHQTGIAWLEEERMKQDIKKARETADIVIVSFHFGTEYELEPSLFQISISQTAIESGADLIIGHHPHVVQPVEDYQTGFIAYSLGNFVFDQSFSEQTMEGLLLKVLVEKKQIKRVTPVTININEFFQPQIEEDLK
jgi:poly-gamma-glutamate synthesis protein (capsule biosynthesis protein)